MVNGWLLKVKRSRISCTADRQRNFPKSVLPNFVVMHVTTILIDDLHLQTCVYLQINAWSLLLQPSISYGQNSWLSPYISLANFILGV